MKKKYEDVKIGILYFEDNDVLTNSGNVEVKDSQWEESPWNYFTEVK